MYATRWHAITQENHHIGNFVSITLLYRLQCPSGNIAEVGWNGRPGIGLLSERTPRIKCCTHLFRVKGEWILSNVYAVWDLQLF